MTPILEINVKISKSKKAVSLMDCPYGQIEKTTNYRSLGFLQYKGPRMFIAQDWNNTLFTYYSRN